MTLAHLIVARAKRDPEFKKQVLSKLRTLAAQSTMPTHRDKVLKAISALEKLK